MNLTNPAGRAQRLILHHGMARIPDEGAWFALQYVSPERLANEALPARYAGAGTRPLGNAILALVTREDFSALHRLRSDETWHFHEGDPAELLLLYPDGHDELVIFGSDSLAGQRPQITVPAGVWMGARPLRDDAQAYSFFGCTLSPGFDYGDYTPGWRDELAAAYPARAGLIAALTRTEFAARPVGLASAPLVAEACAPRSRVLAREDVAATEIAPGVTLRELAGRAAPLRTEAVSVTPFRLAAGASTGSSRYLGAEEFFLVLSGTGVATLGDATFAIGPGALVCVARGEAHALSADEGGPLEFVAIIAPAFNPAHYLPLPPPRA